MAPIVRTADLRNTDNRLTSRKGWSRKECIPSVHDHSHVGITFPERPNYLFLDNVDSALNIRGEKLNLGLRSGDREVLKEFHNRVREAGPLGKCYVMHAPDLKVMRLMFPNFSDLQFRFDVLDGNPRRF